MLKPGDIIQFIKRPNEWSIKGHYVHPESIEFMDLMIKRKRKCKVTHLDEFGCPWIKVIMVIRGRKEWHSWAVFRKGGVA
jgi:hypothetical protein